MLLDTHALVWLRLGDPKLGAHARREIEEAWQNDDLAVSAMSYWEAGMLTARGRIRLPVDADAWRRENLEQGVIEIPVDGAIAVRAGLLPNLHGDPADRIIIATALEGHRLVTGDRRILDWPGNLNRLDATE
ncbi:MAG: type II toxin-antitoxin system VapC family toxin [Chloroflexi bacterium]|nr:type II toxin-antitoxin system VapC family toxin [Chloroflexota bacterium]MYF65597.1 type II toxin-antitoxin system VapC family toxin [Chloroflexota bacterium]MYK35541.1 type II toxin-antitoxin system VapC family toxin [Chloroflexota bacterium]